MRDTGDHLCRFAFAREERRPFRGQNLQLRQPDGVPTFPSTWPMSPIPEGPPVPLKPLRDIAPRCEAYFLCRCPCQPPPYVSRGITSPQPSIIIDRARWERTFTRYFRRRSYLFDMRCSCPTAKPG